METQYENQDNVNKMKQQWQERYKKRHSPAGKVMGGLILVLCGSLFLSREMGVHFPDWYFTWKTLLIIIGIYIGAKHSFYGFGWLIPIAIGSVFLLEDFYPTMALRHYLWPSVLIIAGLAMIFRPRRRWHEKHFEQHFKRHQHKWERFHDRFHNNSTTSENMIETNSVFGTVKKNVISKDFKGGEINVVFGGGEINFNQADINGRAVLEVNAVFGGVKLIIPPHWQIQSDVTAVMGSVEDKRPIQNNTAGDETKVLVLQGSAVFGGIDIKSY